MAPLSIPCPKCSAGLKLPGREFLGRKGKCPKCKHRFVLEEPDEVELELADSPVQTPLTASPNTPLVGTSAKWVPDAEQAADPMLPSAPFPAMTDNSPATDGGAAAFDFNQPSTVPSGEMPATGGSTHELDFSAAVPGDDDESRVVDRVRSRRQKSRRGPIVFGVGTALFVACMGGLWYQYDQDAKAAAAQAAANPQPVANPEWEKQKEELADANSNAKSLSPTSGKQIPLDYMPFVPKLIYHIRPAELWAANRRQQEFVNLTFDLNTWLNTQILNVTGFKPEEIQELTFAVDFGARTSEPSVAAVVRLLNEQSASELQLKRIKGQRRLDLEGDIFEGETYSYLLIDAKTFVVASASMADSLAEARTYSRPPGVELEILTQNSDRERQMTLLFDVKIIDDHREFIFGDDLQVFADKFVQWFGPEVQTVSWSFHLDDEALHLETLLHPTTESSNLKVQRRMRGQLEDLPDTLQQAVRFMQPENLGYRQMIGRFPAMMKATVLGTSNEVDDQFVRMVTYLPTKAAGNLAAGAMLTWNQSTRTDFEGPAPVAAAGPKIPDKIADRLKMSIFVDFRREPLQGALAYIADEIKTPIIINGDALKLSGMTQNMAQTYDLGDVPALQAIDAIIGNPDYKGTLVIVVDEEKKSISLTTRPVAEEAGLPIYETKQ